MKVLQVLGDSAYGGDSYLVGEWCRFLIDRGSEVHGLATNPTTWAELARVRGLTLVDSIFIPREVRPLTHLKAVWQLSRRIRRERYDVVHTHTSSPGAVGRFAAFLARTPLRLHTAHGWPVSEYTGPAGRLVFGSVERLAAHLSTRVICVSYATESRGGRFRLAPARKLVTIRNGVDLAPFEATGPAAALNLRQSLGITPDTFVIGSTSRLAPQKDLATLLRSVIPLARLLAPRELAVLIAGEGPEDHALRKMCERLEINRYVRFLGFRRDIPLLLSALDVFVQTSLWEGLSISILEAMAAAKPIVATDIEPNAEIVEHERTGLRVTTGSPDRIAQAIARFAADPDLAARCGTNARRALLEQGLTVEHTCARLFGLYTSLWQRTTGAPLSEVG
jgi:glycosyltransferase involved in cell wall biosynthesis